MPLLPPIDHILEGLSRVISQYREKPKFNKYLACLLDQVQLLDDATNAVFDAYALDTATGTRLDELGALVGRSRIGATDDEYRLWIKVWIRANRSFGRISDLLGIADLLMPGYTYRLGSGWIEFTAPSSVSTVGAATAIRAALQKAAPQDGRVYLRWDSDALDANFTFAAAAQCLGGDGAAEQAGGWDTAAGDASAGHWLSESTP